MILCSCMKEMLLRAADRSEDAQSCYKKQLADTSQVQRAESGLCSGGDLGLSEGDKETLKLEALQLVIRFTPQNAKSAVKPIGSEAQRGRVLSAWRKVCRQLASLCKTRR